MKAQTFWRIHFCPIKFPHTALIPNCKVNTDSEKNVIKLKFDCSGIRAAAKEGRFLDRMLINAAHYVGLTIWKFVHGSLHWRQLAA